MDFVTKIDLSRQVKQFSATTAFFSGSCNFNESLSGSTLFSGKTNLYDIFLTSSSSSLTNVQPGKNISTGGTSTDPIVNLKDDISLNSISGTSITATTISAATISANTIFVTSISGMSPAHIMGTIINDKSITGNTFISSVASGGGATGSKVLSHKNSNALIQFGAYSENDITISPDNGDLASGGTGYFSNTEASFYWDGVKRISIDETVGTYLQTPSFPVVAGNLLMLGRGEVFCADVNHFRTDSHIIIGSNSNNPVSGDNANKQAIIIGGVSSYFPQGITNSVIIGGTNLSATSKNTVFMDTLKLTNLTGVTISATTLSADTIYGNVVNPYYYKTGVGQIKLGINGVNIEDGNLQATTLSATTFQDFLPQTSLPSPAPGRVFFSGGTLKAMMYCSGDTNNDWVIMNKSGIFI